MVASAVNRLSGKEPLGNWCIHDQMPTAQFNLVDVCLLQLDAGGKPANMAVSPVQSLGKAAQ